MLVRTIRDMFRYGKLNKELAAYFFDWRKAAIIISQQKPFVAYAGLHYQQEKYLIYQGGIPVYPNEIISSAQDIPMLFLNSSSDGIPCWVPEHEGYEITWTPESLKLLTTKLNKE